MTDQFSVLRRSSSIVPGSCNDTDILFAYPAKDLRNVIHYGADLEEDAKVIRGRDSALRRVRGLPQSDSQASRTYIHFRDRSSHRNLRQYMHLTRMTRMSVCTHLYYSYNRTHPPTHLYVISCTPTIVWHHRTIGWFEFEWV